MAANTVQKAALVIAAAVLTIAVLGYMTLETPVAAKTSAANTNSETGASTSMQSSAWVAGLRAANGAPFRRGGFMLGEGGHEQNLVNMSEGRKFTITSTQGKYFVPGTPGQNGVASGTLTFTVTSKFFGEYKLSVSGGSLAEAGTTYTISSGTAQMNRGVSGVAGQGTTAPSGQFIVRAAADGTFVGSTGLASLDLQSGSSEYLVFLAGSISG